MKIENPIFEGEQPIIEDNTIEIEDKVKKLQDSLNSLSKKFDQHKHSGRDNSYVIDNDIRMKTGKILSIGGGNFSHIFLNRGLKNENDTVDISNGKEYLGDTIGWGNDSINMQWYLQHQSEGLKYIGNWADETYYQISDAVHAYGYHFRCSVSHTSSSATEPGVGADWADYWQVVNNWSFNYSIRPPLYTNNGLSVTSGGDTITDSTRSWKVNELVGAYISVIGTTSLPLETHTITENTATQITINGTWGASDSSVQYTVWRPVYFGTADFPWRRIYLTDDIRFGLGASAGAGVIYIKYGTGSPEGAVTANVGSIYMRRDGGAGTTFYVKESGTGNTGWVASGGGSQTSKARAYRGTSVQTIPTAEATKVQLNAESYDVDGEFDSTTNYRFTATTSGYYQVNAAVRYDVATADKMYLCIVRRNGTDVMYNQFHASVAQPITSNISDVVYMTAGQYLELFTYHDSGVDRNVSYGDARTFLSVHKLS